MFHFAQVDKLTTIECSPLITITLEPARLIILLSVFVISDYTIYKYSTSYSNDFCAMGRISRSELTRVDVQKEMRMMNEGLLLVT